MIRHQLEYQNLPLDFWNTVIYYEFFVSHSGFLEVEPHINIWTLTGERYYINVNELRDGRFERVIPFFESMANQEKIEKGEFYYWDWKLVPEGWNYYYAPHNHCFISDSVYQEFSVKIEKAEQDRKNDTRADMSIEELVTEQLLWKCLLKQAYKKVLDVDINEDAITYIRLNEKIHVYDEPYAGRRLDIHQIADDEKAELKEAVAWSIDYTTPISGLYNLIKVVIYFEDTEPFVISYEFERKELSSYIDEDEFMHPFMEIAGCDLGGKENGYNFKNAPNGYSVYQKMEHYNIYWIRDDIYKKHYESVIEPFINYSGKLFLSLNSEPLSPHTKYH